MRFSIQGATVEVGVHANLAVISMNSIDKLSS